METSGDQFVGVGLMSHIPDHLVPVQIERLVERQGEFNNTKARSEMTTAGGHNLEMPLPDLAGNILKLGQAEAVQLIRMS